MCTTTQPVILQTILIIREYKTCMLRDYSTLSVIHIKNQTLQTVPHHFHHVLQMVLLHLHHLDHKYKSYMSYYKNATSDTINNTNYQRVQDLHADLPLSATPWDLFKVFHASILQVVS